MTSPPATTPLPQLSRARRRWLGPLVALLVSALFVWYGVLLASSAAPATVTGGPAAFLPDDGSRYPATFTQGDHAGPAMVENTRLHGIELTFAMSEAAFTYLDPPAGGLDDADWWRESVVPGDLTQPSRYRIRSYDGQGIWLRVQDWEGLGVSFQHLLEIPVDVAVGRSWSSSRRAVAEPVSTQLTYRNTSTARAASDPERAAAGCLAVTSTTDLTGGSAPLSWRETSLWCPGAGSVISEGSFRGTRYRIQPLPSAPLDEDVPTGPAPSSDVSGWSVREESLLNGDATFGSRAAELTPAVPPVTATNGVVTLPVAGGDTVTGLVPTVPGTVWWHWWAHPGGDITALAAVGRLVAVTTTRRELVVYGAGGRWLWSTVLDDVAAAAPLELSGNRIAVATVGGNVAVYDARTGAELWRHRLTYGVFNPLASDGQVLAVADAGPHVTAFDLATGQQLWQNDAGSTFGTALAVGAGSVTVTGSGTVAAYDTRTGSRSWYRSVGLGLGQAVPHDDQLWIETGPDRVESWGLADGHTRWIAEDLRLTSSTRCRLTDGPAEPALQLAFRGTDLVGVDDGGRVRRAWSLSASAHEVRSVDCGGGRIWVSSYAADGSSDLRVESIGPS